MVVETTSSLESAVVSGANVVTGTAVLVTLFNESFAVSATSESTTRDAFVVSSNPEPVLRTDGVVVICSN